MSISAVATLTILVAALAALATQRLRPDVVALLVTLALVLTGVLTAEEAFSAFGQPVIIIIPSIYVLGAALYETGVATMIANRLVRFSDRGPGTLVVVIMAAAGLLSSVLSGLLVVAVLIPAVLRTARQARQPPAQLLLPLVAGSTMGNLLTVIGTISTLVVSDLLAAGGHEPLSFFSVTPYGLVLLVLAILWYLFAGRRLLRQDLPVEPQRPSLEEVEDAYDLDKVLYRLRVRSVSDLIAQRLEDSELSRKLHLNVVAIKPHQGNLKPARPDWVLERDDILIVEGARGEVLQAASLHHLEPKGAMSLDAFNRLEEENLRLAEVMVPFRSELVGQTLAESGFRERYGLNVLAVQRQGRAIREDLPRLTLTVGDALLVQGSTSRLDQVGEDLNLVLATLLGPQPGELITSKAKLTLGILGAMLILVVPGFISLATASLGAALALILTGCLSLDRAYKGIDGSIIVLIGGMLPLAMALEKTGAAELIAGQLVTLSQIVGAWVGLLLLYLAASVMTQIISNAVTAALMTPIALNLAVAQGLSPHPFALAVAVAVTTSYVTPLTNTDNLMVREAGRYTMRDYLVNGLPLFALQTVVVMLLLTLAY